MLKKRLKKPLALLLTFVMVMALLPTSLLNAHAEGDESIPTMASLKLYSDMSRQKSFKLTPEFSPDIHAYTVDCPDNLPQGSYYIAGTAARDGDYAKAVLKTPWGQVSKAALPTLINPYNNASMTVRVGPKDNIDADNGDSVYEITLNRRVTLNTLRINDTLQPAFNPDITTYTAGVDEKATDFSITLNSPSFPCTIKVNDSDVNWGGGDKQYTFPLNWNENGKMPVDISLASGMRTGSYHVTLIKESKGSTPVISVNPQSADYDDAQSAAPLTVKATANGDLTYQWYKNQTNSNKDGTIIDGATNVNYTPEIAKVSGITPEYYYCQVTNTGEGGSTAVSEAAAITVYPDATPIITCKNADNSPMPETAYEYKVGDTSVGLKVEASSPVAGGEFLYTFKKVWKDSDATVTNYSSSNVYTPITTSDGEDIIFCTVTYLVNGRSYNADSAKFPPVRVYSTSAVAPFISQHPSGATYQLGETKIKDLRVGGYVPYPGSGTITYQWYTSADGKDFTPIKDANAKKYTPPIPSEAGVAYYKCVLTNTFTSVSGNSYTSSSDSAVATVRFIKGYTEWDGKGTEAEPFLVKDLKGLEELQGYVNTGESFRNYSFKMDADITLPDTWVPIGSLKQGADNPSQGENIYPFSASFDGAGHTLTISEGGKPLFGYVRLANIQNLNITGTKINGSALINDYTVDYGATGNYSDVPAYIADIRNVTLKSGSSTLCSGLVNGNGSGMNNVYFTNCTIESGVTVGYNKDQSNIGSFISCLNGNLIGCVSSADVYGVNYVGGLAGIKGQSMGDCSIWDSVFKGTVTASGNYAGGIMGGGYSDQSAPNSPCVTIQNCYVTGSINAKDYIGGIFGGEAGVAECWENGIGYIQDNYFSGKITASEGAANVGGIIGFMRSLDRYNVISDNYFIEGCGTTKGIATVSSVDKTTALYSRSDDPTGTDSSKLTTSVPAAALTDGSLVTKLNAGSNSNKSWTAGTSSPEIISNKHILKITVDGIVSNRFISKNINDLKDLKIVNFFNDRSTANDVITDADVQGYDTTSKGDKTVTLTKNNYTYIFKLTVINTDPSPDPGGDNNITVYFTLLGDEIHDSDKDGVKHTLKSNNLSTWIAKTSFKFDKNVNVKVRAVFEKALTDAGMTWENKSGNYVSSITKDGMELAEFTNGKYSGWMYTLNGVHSMLGLNEQYLKNGDVIVWHYTDDYRLEQGSEKWNDSGSGTSGNSGGSTKITPKATESNGKAAVDLALSDIKEAIASAKTSGEAIVIAPKITGTAKNVTVSLQKDAISAIAKQTEADITVKTPVGSVTMPNSALSSISSQAAGSTVTVSLGTVDTATLTETQKSSVGSSSVYDISVLSGSGKITEFGGSELTISLPYTLKDGENASGVTVWYMDTSGTLQKMTAAYDKETGLATFTTTHLSYYLVGYTAVYVNPFADVKDSNWFYEAVKFVSQKSIMGGTTATSFEPDANMTRAMVVTVLYRLEGKPVVTGTKTFSDVEAGQWYTDAVIWASTNKIVGGYGNGIFGTNDSVTREQLAVILFNYAKYKGYSVTGTKELSSYADASSVSSWANYAMKWAYAEGLISGTTATTLEPSGTATRAQVSTILMRFVEKFVK